MTKPYCLPYYKQTYKQYPHETSQEIQNAYIKIYTALKDIEQEKWCDIVIGLKPDTVVSGKDISLSIVCDNFIKKYEINPNLFIYEYLV
jgi:hypothetical protein